MKKILLVFIALTALTLVTTACKKQETGSDVAMPGAKSAEDKGVTVTGEDTGVTVATVNGTAIYQKDFDKALERKKSSVGNRELTDEEKKSALNELVDFELFFQEGMKQGLFNDDFIKRRVITNVLQKDVWDKANVMKYSDEEIKAYYDAHQDEFKEPLKVHASHILIKLAPNATDAQKKAAKAKADEVFALAKKTPAKWLEISKKYSEVPTRDRGGDLGFFSRDHTPQQFGDAAFGASAGDIVGPIETNFGYHIIRVGEKQKEGVMDFKKAKAKARMSLITSKRDQMKDQYVQKLHVNAKVDIKTPL